MNRLLIVVFDNEKAAEAGTRALRLLHAEGSLTVYTSSVVAKDAAGTVSVKASTGQDAVGAGVGLAVGSLIGLLGGPIGLAIGAVAGTLAGTLRDYWVAGVGIDFVEQAQQVLAPGKVALIAEVEEDWVMPVDSRMEAAGGVVFRRARGDVAEARYEHDLDAVRAEIGSLQAEIQQAGTEAQTGLKARLAATTARFDELLVRAKQQVEAVKEEADTRIRAIETQLSQTQGAARSTLDTRIQRVRSAYHARSAKLERAWALAKEAIAP